MNPVSSRIDDRNKSFQRSIPESSIKKLREDNFIKLRKSKRKEDYIKRARLAIEFNEALSEEFIRIPEILTNLDISLSDTSTSPYMKIKNLASLILKATDENVLFAGIEHMRKFVSSEQIKPLEILTETELFNRLSYLLEYPNEGVKFNTAWIITNLSSINNSNVLMRMAQNGVIESLGKLANEENVQEYSIQAAWALSNFAGDSDVFCKAVYNTGIFSSIIRKINTNTQLDLVHLGLYVWLISNLLKFKPYPSSSVVKDFLNILPKLLLQSNEEILIDTLRSIFYITTEDSYISDIFNTCMISRIVFLSKHDSKKIKENALQTLCNLSTGDEVQVQYLLDNKIIEVLTETIQSEKNHLVKDSIFILTNIVGQSERFSSLLITQNVFFLVVNQLKSLDREVRTEALIFIKLCLEHAKGIQRVINQELISSLIGAMQSNDQEGIIGVFKVLKLVFSVEDQGLAAAREFFDLGGVQVLEKLQGHPNIDIYNGSLFLLDEYFLGEAQPQMEPIYSNLN